MIGFLYDGNDLIAECNIYDAYGLRTSTNSTYASRFSYTGQVWLAEVNLYYYKARMYNARLGRFMQTDPIGYDDGLNWYAYVHGDPVNRIDPMGTDDVAVIPNPNGTPAEQSLVQCDSKCMADL